jgi:hypothetical protein
MPTKTGPNNTIETRARDYFGRVPSDAIKVKRNVVLLVDQDGIWRYVEEQRGEIAHRLCGKVVGADSLNALGEACTDWAAA